MQRTRIVRTLIFNCWKFSLFGSLPGLKHEKFILDRTKTTTERPQEKLYHISAKVSNCQKILHPKKKNDIT